MTKMETRKDTKNPLPAGWRWVKLGEVCELNPRRPSIQRKDCEPTSFIPMEAVDAVSGVVSDLRIRPYGEVKKGYTYFAEGDVLFAKITPCMQNGKHIVAQGLIGGIGFGTTEFHVLRPSEAITSEFIWCFVRQPSVLIQATEHFTGAVGQQRLPEDYLANLGIPLPPLSEQRRIAGVLREQMGAVERARAAAHGRLGAAKALQSSYLRAVFNGPEARQWPARELGEISTVIMGQSPPGRSYNNNGEGDYLLNGPSEFGPNHPEPVQWTTQPTRFCEPGDVLFCVRGATTGRKCWADQRYCIGRGLAIIRGTPGTTSTQFLWHLLDVVTPVLLKKAAGSTFVTLPGDELRRLPVRVPSLLDQQRIAGQLREQMAAVENARAAAEEELNTINALPAALLRRAFKGEV